MGSQLRTFTLFNKTAAQSVYTYPCNLIDFDGNLIAGAAGSFLQFHDKATTASAGNVPIKSFYISSAGPTPLASIFQAIGPVSFSLGLSIGISSTEATYTAQTATFDIFGEIEEGAQSTDDITGLTTVTSVGADTGMNIWTRATAPKRLFSLTVINGEGANMYVCLQISTASDVVAPADGTRITQVLPGGVLANTASRTYYFGQNGLPDLPYWKSNTALGVFLSSTAPNATAGTSLASTFTALFKS